MTGCVGDIAVIGISKPGSNSGRGCLHLFHT